LKAVGAIRLHLPARPRRGFCELRLERRSRRFAGTKVFEVGSPNGRLVLLGMPQLSQQPFGVRAPAVLYQPAPRKPVLESCRECNATTRGRVPHHAGAPVGAREREARPRQVALRFLPIERTESLRSLRFQVLLGSDGANEAKIFR